MISSLILAVALTGQITASDGPARTWNLGTVNGKAEWLWSWKNANGYVLFHKHENKQLWPDPKPVAPAVKRPVILGAGMVLEAGGTINSGLKLKDTHPTGIIDTNDPDLGSKLSVKEDCPDEPADPELPAKQDIPWGWVAAAFAFVVLIVTWDREPK